MTRHGGDSADPEMRPQKVSSTRRDVKTNILLGRLRSAGSGRIEKIVWHLTDLLLGHSPVSVKAGELIATSRFPVKDCERNHQLDQIIDSVASRRWCGPACGRPDAGQMRSACPLYHNRSLPAETIPSTGPRHSKAADVPGSGLVSITSEQCKLTTHQSLPAETIPSTGPQHSKAADVPGSGLVSITSEQCKLTTHQSLPAETIPSTGPQHSKAADVPGSGLVSITSEQCKLTTHQSLPAETIPSTGPQHSKAADVPGSGLVSITSEQCKLTTHQV
ncbi:hypothetical protein J6590_063768 [Homalodisca vitripennis]|nr:hypothetical protein J6590_063768 [Homalodisca vitripennis]